MKDRVNVTKIFMPDVEKYKSYIDKIYESGHVTNFGPMSGHLQERLEEYLRVKNLLLVSNGSVALHLAYKLLDLQGEVITTPFSFVATTSTIAWEGLTPVFVDIDPRTLNIDAKQIESRITDKTSAIVVTHVFGNVCDIEEIQRIADQYHLKVIYDAAHCFGTLYRGQSVFSYGNVSTTSFHATKIFHSIEGGAVFINDPSLYGTARSMINFGLTNGHEIAHIGTNFKMSEFHAAMGLCVLDETETIQNGRKRATLAYEACIEKYGLHQSLSVPAWNPLATRNYSYFPVVFDSEETLLDVVQELQANQIYPRRYFYPSLETLPYVQGTFAVPNSSSISKRILCLPLYADLEESVIEKIVALVAQRIKSSGC